MINVLPVLLVSLSVLQTGEWNVVDFGALADGVTDNTASFQQALDAAAAAGGGTVRVPPGHYRFDGVLSIPGAVTLQGTFHAPPTDQREGRPNLDGSVLLAYAGRGAQTGPPFIRLAGSMANLSGFIITYPEWQESDVPPVPYPPTVSAQGNANVAVMDCCLLNSYEGMHFQDSGRFLVRNVYGYPSFRGLYVDNCLDIGRVENCHFWPFGVHGASDYTTWINKNGVAFEFARTDWQYVLNTFCFGYGIGYKFSTTENGSCNGNFLGIGADSCQRGIVVDTVPGVLDLLITNGEFVGRWASTDAVGVEITGKTTGRVSLNNCAFWGPLDRAIWSHAPRANLAVNSCGFVFWDIGANDSPAVQVDGGKAILQGNSFSMEGIDVRIGEDVASAILTANQAPIGLCVENLAGARTQLVANETVLLDWPRGAKGHYRVRFGALGDSRYVRGFHSRELARPWNKQGTMRWGGANPRLLLPVVQGQEYVLTLEAFVPAESVGKDNGLYLDGQSIAAFPMQAGTTEISAVIKPQDRDTVEVVLRGTTWQEKSQPNSPDNARPLTVGVRQLTMKAMHAPDDVFDANTREPVD